MTKLRTTRHVACPFSAALELAEKAVAQADGLYLTPSPPFGEWASVEIRSTTDRSDDARKHDALLIAWRPRTPGMFPEFRGVLTVRPEHRGVSLRLSGQYEPPFRLAGKLFDFFIGRAIAQRTIHHLLDGLAANIETEYQKELQQIDTPS